MSDEETQDPLGLRSIVVDAELQVRDETKREVDMRVMPWGTTVQTVHGLEEFAPGAFDGADLSKVYLYGLEHEIKLGIGQNGEITPTRHVIGRAMAAENRADGQHATFKVARTAAGDEFLALASDRIVSGVSVEMTEVPGGTVVTREGGRRKRTHARVDWRGVSPTHRPAYGDQAAVLAVRSQEEKPVSEDTTEIVPVNNGPDIPAIAAQLQATIEKVEARAAASPDYSAKLQSIMDRLDKQDEQARAAFELPSNGGMKKDDFTLGHWTSLVLRMMSGERVSQKELEVRVAAELITTDNLGVVPEQWLGSLIQGIIDPARPFLQTTRKIDAPAAGMTFNVPRIATRPTVGVQAAEKDELVSTTTSITSDNFNPTSIGGYGDISLQLLKRSDPSYLNLYTDLLFEAYAAMADDKAVDALLAETAVVEGGAIDPDDGPLFGDAWANAAAVSRLLRPDTIWLSSAAVAAFINAKSDTTNAPLYGNLAGAFSAAGGTGGTISGLRPVHVPALDDESVDAIVGPSRAFVWAEDGTYTLQVDVPALAGREVGIFGMIWFMPLYPAAFTSYTVAS